jgi:ligand-binding sensor domain-containing protein
MKLGMGICGAFLLAASASTLLPVQTRSWRLEDRAVITDFSVVDAVAASSWMVYAATRHGLLLYDRRSRTWQLPITSLDGYPAGRARLALADPAGNAVWIGTADGWARYDADLKRWDRGTVPGGVSGMMLDAGDAGAGVFLRTTAGWTFLPRGGFAPLPGTPLPPPSRQVQPLDVQSALATAPMAEAQRALILTDPRLRTYQFTAAARTADDNDIFFGTSGLGLVRLDPTMGQWEPLGFSLLAPGADALAQGSDGVWAISGANPGTRSGITWLPGDLSSAAPVEPPAGNGFGAARIRRALAAGRTLWLATDAGVFKTDPATGRTRRFTLADGLPSEDVRALVPAPDGVWVGTARGLAVITAGDQVERVGGWAQPVLCLLAVRESLWVGTAVGLGVIPPGARAPLVPAEVAAEPTLGNAIVALARTGDTVAAVLDDQVAWRDPQTGRWTLERPRAPLGRILAAASDAGGVWLGGAIGLAWWRIGRREFRGLTIPGDLPAPVRDLAVQAPWLWVATDSGVVRLRRDVVTGGGR